MTHQTVRVLLGDTDPASHAVLESLCEEQGWQLLTAESSFQVLRLMRNTPDIAVLLINPSLAGSGVSGKDVARTIKTSAQFASLPVILVLHEGQTPPEGLPVNGIVQIDHAGPVRLLAAMREAMGGVQGEVAAPPAGREQHAGDIPRAEAKAPVRTTAGLPPAESVVPGRPVRIVVADTSATTRPVLVPLFERLGWELIAVDSGVQALRVVRDREVDAVLIDPHLKLSGISGTDIARTIKGAAQFRKLPVLFVLHEGQPSPEGLAVDGSLEVDSWPPARVMSVLGAAIGRAVEVTPESAVAVAAAPAVSPPALPLEPSGAAPSPGRSAEVLAPTIPAAQLTELRAELRAVVDAAVKGLVESAMRQYAATEGRNLAEQAASLAREIIPSAVDRLVRDEIARLPEPQALVRELLPGLREEALQEVRHAAEEGRAEARSGAEQVVGAMAREVVPPIAERLVQRQLERLPNLATRIDAALPGLREEILANAQRVVEAVARNWIDAEGRGSVEAVMRRYAATEGVGVVERSIQTAAREIVPAVVERLVREEIDRGARPAGAMEALLAEIRGRMLDEARQAVAAIAERLVREEIAQEARPAEKFETLLAEIRGRMLDEARQAVETAARRYAETEGAAVVERVIRAHAALPDGVRLMDEVVRAVAREMVPAVAERLIQAEILRLREEYRLA